MNLAAPSDEGAAGGAPAGGAPAAEQSAVAEMTPRPDVDEVAALRLGAVDAAAADDGAAAAPPLADDVRAEAMP